MRLLNYILIASIILLSNSLRAQEFDTALDYLNFISEEQVTISKNMWKYTKALAHSKSDRSIDKKRLQVIKSLERAIQKIEKAKSFGDSDFKNQVLHKMRLNESLMKNDYAKIIDMKEVAEQSYDAMEAYMVAQELADKKMEEAQAEYELNLNRYAIDNNITLVESESDLGNKMKLSNEVFKHYNEMYLVFFKVHINQIYLWDAINKNDVNSIQQNANALNQAAKEGLEKLETIEAYKNDRSVIEATKKAFETYIDEAENMIPQITDFLITNQDFETIKNTLEKTPERKRTKEQVDTYNQKVKEINKAINNYNKVNQDLNTEIQKVLNNLDTANNNFLARHIPKD